MNILDAFVSSYVAVVFCLYSPSKSLLVITVDLAGLLELSDELVDGLLVLLGVEVDDESVDHFGGNVA